MPDRPFRVVDDLIRRVQRVAASRPDPVHILAQMIRMIGESDVDPYAVLGVLVEGAAHTLAKHVPSERQADTATTLLHLLEERLEAHRLTGDIGGLSEPAAERKRADEKRWGLGKLFERAVAHHWLMRADFEVLSALAPT
jgi:hypothetical protein